MVKIKNVFTAFLSLVMTSTMALAELPEDYGADTASNHYVGETIDDAGVIGDYWNIDGEHVFFACKEYEVVPNDSPCSISRNVMSKEYGIEPTEGYWPVFCYLNGYPDRVIHPGETVYYPETLEDCERLYAHLQITGFVDYYYDTVYDIPRQYRGYDREAILQRIQGSFMTDYTISNILNGIYGEGTSQNMEFVDTYLNMVGLSNYNEVLVLDEGLKDDDGLNIKLNNEEVFRLTEWIPTLEDVTSNLPSQENEAVLEKGTK